MVLQTSGWPKELAWCPWRLPSLLACCCCQPKGLIGHCRFALVLTEPKDRTGQCRFLLVSTGVPVLLQQVVQGCFGELRYQPLLGTARPRCCKVPRLLVRGRTDTGHCERHLPQLLRQPPRSATLASRPAGRPATSVRMQVPTRPWYRVGWQLRSMTVHYCCPLGGPQSWPRCCPPFQVFGSSP